MYVFMYTCTVCMYLCMYVCVYVFMYECMYVCMHVFMDVCIHVSMYQCMYACKYVCICMYVWICDCMYASRDVFMSEIVVFQGHINELTMVVKFNNASISKSILLGMCRHQTEWFSPLINSNKTVSVASDSACFSFLDQFGWGRDDWNSAGVSLRMI